MQLTNAGPAKPRPIRLALFAGALVLAGHPPPHVLATRSQYIDRPSSAVSGIVALRKSHCDYFIVATGLGYDLLEWYGGNDPSQGDELVGKFEEYGFHDIYNTTAEEELTVWVEDYWLSKTRAIEKFYDKCD